MNDLTEGLIINRINKGVDELIDLQETQVKVVNDLLKSLYDYYKLIEQMAKETGVSDETDS